MLRENPDLPNKEKALVALAAAMGGGCRTCADGLYPMAQAAGASTDEIERALREGLQVRENATAIMKRKAETLLGHRIPALGATEAEEAPGISRLTRLAAAVAANAAPDAVRHLEGASFAGVTEGAINVALAIARKVRTKAQGFSDEEIDQSREERHREAASRVNEAAAECDGNPESETCFGEDVEKVAEACACR